MELNLYYSFKKAEKAEKPEKGKRYDFLNQMYTLEKVLYIYLI